MVDYNFNFYSRILSKWLQPIKRFYRKNRYYYKQEPWLIFEDMFKFVLFGLKITFKNNVEQKMDSDEIKIMRDKNVEVFDGINPFEKGRESDKIKRERLKKNYK